LVEDAHINQLLAQSLLVEAGYSVSIAGDGRQAMDAIASSKPDLLILDLMMPIMDGFTFLERIRNRLDIPILVVSARSDIDSIEKAIELGAADYLIKPFNSSDLLNKVERLLYQP